MPKNKVIFLRVEEKEKEKIQQFAAKRGFDSVTAYILFILRKDMKE